MKLKPLGNRVLLEAVPAEEKTKGGIIIPDTAKDEKNPEQGKVVAVGNDKNLDVIKKGDIVLFSKYSQSEVEIDGKKYLVISGDNVLAVISTKKENNENPKKGPNEKSQDYLLTWKK